MTPGPPGRMVDIGGGRRLHVYESGTGAGPTVVFESGICATSLNWRGLQQKISPFARSISYDRAGLGWSDFSPGPRTPSNLAAELHSLLRAAGTAPPYILVGHSFGGLIVRRFAQLYPVDVAGIVLLDPLQPSEWCPLSPERARELETGRRLARRGFFLARCGILKLASRLLLTRLPAGRGTHSSAGILERIAEQARKMPPEVWPAIAAHWSNPQFFKTALAYLRDLPESAREMADVIDGPFVTITAATANSSHWVHLDKPDLVAKVILDMLAAQEILPHARADEQPVLRR